MITWDTYKSINNQVANRSAAARGGQTLRLVSAPKRTKGHLQFITTTTSRFIFKKSLVNEAASTFLHHQLERNQREMFNLTHLRMALSALMLHMDFAQNIQLIECQQRCALLALSVCSMANHTLFIVILCSLPFSQADFFNTTQLALLMVIASFLHPITCKKLNWSFAFISDDPKHSSVSCYCVFCIPFLIALFLTSQF